MKAEREKALGASVLSTSQPHRSLPYGHPDADYTFPYRLPSHLTNVAFLLLFVSHQHLQAEIKALCVTPLCRGSHARAQGGGCLMGRGGDSVAAYLGDARLHCPLSSPSCS